MSYRFHVDEESLELVNDHYGGYVTEDSAESIPTWGGSWTRNGHRAREFPDVGKGDFRLPAVRIKQAQGYTMCNFQYQSHALIDGKPGLPGLPSLFDHAARASTLVITLMDEHSSVSAELSYTVFPAHDAIARSVKILNNSDDTVVLEKLASFSIDLPYSDYDLIQLQGEWGRECNRIRRRVDYGLQG
jgi:alpha-galactosidase